MAKHKDLLFSILLRITLMLEFEHVQAISCLDLFARGNMYEKPFAMLHKKKIILVWSTNTLQRYFLEVLSCKVAY